jgi:anti-sigma regulatory factor (Ser/Thr protein kinase)
MSTYSTSRSFVADPKGVVAADDWMEQLVSQWGVDEGAAYKARLCVSELAANLIMHDKKMPGLTFVVTLTRNGADAGVEIVDDGSPFDPTAAPALERSPADPPRIGGLGLNLIRSYANRIAYKRETGRNHTRLDFVGVARDPECSAESAGAAGS